MTNLTRHLYYRLDETGEPVPCEDSVLWGLWFETADRTIAQDIDEGHEGDESTKVRVSTVFLGLDHNHTASGPPVLWETLVFGGLLDGEMVRYTSREDALIGHQAMCRLVTEAQAQT